MEEKYEYRYRNIDKGICLIYVYFDGILWIRYRIRGHYKGGNIVDFLNERLLSGNVYSCAHYLEFIDKYIEDKQFMKGGINNET